MKRAFYDSIPAIKEAVGNGNYFYRWDITEEEVQNEPEGESTTKWSCYEVIVSGEPTYNKCVEAIIREQYTTSEELALINKFNSYNQGIIEDSTIVEEYKSYLQFVADTKQQVKTNLTETFVL